MSIGLVWLVGCSPEGTVEPKRTESMVKTPAPAEVTVRLGWGRGDGQVAGTAPAYQQMANGPSAVAVGSDGAAYVLDRFNGRVLRVDGRSVTAVATVPEDAEVLAAGADPAGGTVLAAWSPLQAKVWLRSGNADAGEVILPRALRLARRISVGPSRQVLVHNAHQETYRLGSPAAGRSLAAVLHSKREGAAFTADGRGLQVRRRGDGRAEVLVLTDGQRGVTPRRILLSDTVLAARIVGVADHVVCLRLEKSAGANTVQREAVCLRTADGAEVLRKDLGLPGRYVPRQELDLGGHPARLAWIRPSAAGLQVTLWPLPARSKEVSP